MALVQQGSISADARFSGTKALGITAPVQFEYYNKSSSVKTLTARAYVVYQEPAGFQAKYFSKVDTATLPANGNAAVGSFITIGSARTSEGGTAKIGVSVWESTDTSKPPLFDYLGFDSFLVASEAPLPPLGPPAPPEIPPATLPVPIDEDLLNILKKGAELYVRSDTFASIVLAAAKVFKSDAESGNKYSRMLAAVNPVNAAAMFGDFIGEEAMQTAMFPVSILIREKQWAAASRQLEFAKETWKSIKAYRDTFGELNVSTGDIFETNLQAVASSLLEYKKLIDSNYDKDLELPEKFEALAREIIDGDTIRVIFEGRSVSVRLVGINTPERGEPFFSNSKRALFNMVWGEKITIYADPANFEDNSGRLLAVVKHGALDVNAAMVSQGWAFYYPLVPHKFINDKEFKALDESARTGKKGIWGLKEMATSDKSLSLVQMNTLYANGKITRKELESYLQKIGYDAEEIEYINLLRGGVPKELGVSQIEDLYNNKIISREEVIQRLRELGYTDTDATKLSLAFRGVPVTTTKPTGIKVSSLPSRAPITIDGTYTYKLTSETILTEAGKHLVKVAELGYEEQEQEVTVPAGTVVEVHFKLNKL